jgi:hypothetical protein
MPTEIQTWFDHQRLRVARVLRPTDPPEPCSWPELVTALGMRSTGTIHPVYAGKRTIAPATRARWESAIDAWIQREASARVEILRKFSCAAPGAVVE